MRGTPGTALVHAVGTVTNQSSHQRFGLRITVELRNAQGQSLGVSTDYLDVLEPGAEWQFKALVIHPKATSAKLQSLTEDQ